MIREVFYNALLPLGASANLRTLQCLGNVLGNVMWHALPGRRAEALQAISERLEVSEARAREIGQRNFCESACAFLEIFHTRKMDIRFLQDRVEFETPELMVRLAATTRPVVAIGAHFGCWELMVGMINQFSSKQRGHIVVRLPKDKALADMILHMRSQPRVRILPHRDAAKETLGQLRSGGLSAFLVDHNCSRDEAEFLPFLGKLAAVNKGPALLAMRAKAEVWPLFPLRLDNGRFRLIVRPPLDTATLTGTMGERIRTVCQFYTAEVEAIVRQYPEQWFWMHRRWKTQPKDEV